MTNEEFDKIIRSQEEYIEKAFDKEAVENSNYGWYQGNNLILTKVYGRGVLGSSIERGRVKSSFDPC